MGLFSRKGSSSDRYLETLDALYHQDKDRAIKILTNEVSRKTDQPIPYLWLGNLLQQRGEYQRAEVIFENLARRPKLQKNIEKSAWRGAADCANKTGNLEKLIYALNEYIKLEPKDSLAKAELFCGKGKLEEESGNKENAAKEFEKAISADKRFGSAYLLLGDLYEEDDPKKSLKVWQQLLKLRPDLIQVLHPRVRKAFEVTDSLKGYESFLKKLCSKSPNGGFPYLVLGRYYLEIDENEHAKQNFEKAKGPIATRRLALLELIKLTIERWDQSGALAAADETLSAIQSNGFVWKCSECERKIEKKFLPSCESCKNWIDIHPLEISSKGQ